MCKIIYIFSPIVYTHLSPPTSIFTFFLTLILNRDLQGVWIWRPREGLQHPWCAIYSLFVFELQECGGRIESCLAFFLFFSFSVLRPWYNSLYKGQILLPCNSGIREGKWAYEIASESDLLVSVFLQSQFLTTPKELTPRAPKTWPALLRFRLALLKLLGWNTRYIW